MVKAKSIGAGLGSFFNNPGVVGIAAIAIGLFLFRDKISNFFQGGIDSIGSGLGNININLPEIALPSISLPEISLPSFELPNIFAAPEVFPIDPSSQAAIDNPLNKVTEFVQRILPQGFNEERTGVSFGTEIIVPRGDEFNLGGGPSFIGGTTTFGDNLVDTLSEVLRSFPSLTASQAADALAANPGLTQSQFGLINPDVINISNFLEGGDSGPVTSGGFGGLTPEQIASLLTGGNISNF